MFIGEKSFLNEQIEAIHKKFKVNNNYEFISYRDNCYKLETFKQGKDYSILVYRQNNFTGEFSYYTSSGYITSKEQLKRSLTANCIYLYDL